MIVEQFDRQTMARMEVALDRACEHFAYGGKHDVRKRVAQSIIRCAKAGNASLDALTEAGERASAQPSHHGGEDTNTEARVLGRIGRARHSKCKSCVAVAAAAASEADLGKESGSRWPERVGIGDYGRPAVEKADIVGEV